jgi:lipopolysaccharide/colanic/teichoic acid biosynthesis glycosyltransferase
MASRNKGTAIESVSPALGVEKASMRVERVAFSSRRAAKTPLTERFLAAGLLAACAPVLAGATIAVAILSRRSPFVALRRVGLHGKPFWLLKLRTMWDRDRSSAEPAWVEYLEETDIPLVKTSADPRVTSRFAALARRFSLDELPQLVHVVEGKMRLAGPRPLTSLELDAFYGDSAAEILQVLPGITGLWQVMGRNRLTYKQRLRLDRFFVRHSGLKLYLWVLLRTPASVLRGQGAC